jgi:hypothetical protein
MDWPGLDSLAEKLIEKRVKTAFIDQSKVKRARK